MACGGLGWPAVQILLTPCRLGLVAGGWLCQSAALSRCLIAGSRRLVVRPSAVTGGDLGWPAVTWDEVLSAVVRQNQQETADPEVILPC